MTHDDFHPGCGCSFCDGQAVEARRISQASPRQLRAFHCSHVRYPAWGVSTYNTLTASAAKAAHFRALREIFPNIAFTDLRVRLAGPAHSSEDFIRCAIKRGLPDLRCGDTVLSAGARGLVVGHNSSANFDVLFIEGPHANLTLNVHPSGFSPQAAAVA